MPLRKLTWRSLFDPEPAIPTLQAVLILCLWPVPADRRFPDQNHTIAGAAMQIAMQEGLPYASKMQGLQASCRNIWRPTGYFTPDYGRIV
jgi:hypothetical protein